MMRCTPALALAAALVAAQTALEAADIQPARLRCEYRQNPLGIDSPNPRLSWIVKGQDPNRRGLGQTAYQVLVAGTREQLDADRGELWDSGKVASEETIQIAYAGRKPRAGEQCWWKVRLWDRRGEVSPWSDPATWTMGLFFSPEEDAAWIGRAPRQAVTLDDCQWIWFPGKDPAVAAPPGVRYFRKVLALPPASRLLRARLFLAADNEFTAYVNGQTIGQAPGWSTARAYDVTERLHAGANVLAVAATNGTEHPNPAGLIGKLIVELAHGRRIVLRTDGSWKSSQAAATGWNTPKVDDSAWPAAQSLGDAKMEPWGVPAVRQDLERLPLLRRGFDVSKPVRRAVVSVCGLGQYELRLNGGKVGDHVLDPGWTNYRKTCLYATYDVTEQIRQGENCLGVMLGNGMYRVGGGRYVKFTGSFGAPKLALRLRLEYADGSTSQIDGDGAWRVAPGPITFSSIYGGEDYDARLEQPGWDQPGFDAAGWQAATVVDGPGGTLAAQSAPPIKVIQTLAPVAVSEPTPGVFVCDLGQNFSGRPVVSLEGPAGAKVRITPAELLDEKGLANQSASGGPSYFSYTLKGSGIETWRPRFSYYGFRYLQVEGAAALSAAAPGTATDQKPVLLKIEGQFTRSSARRVGRFACSNELFNRIDRLVDWAVGSNLQSVLTDCPHREKLGWLEVPHLMGPSIMYNYDVASLYAKITRDTSQSQRPDGLVPDIAPEYVVFSGGFRDSPEWGSAAVILPWQLYQWYGDRRVLAARYPTMKRYVDYLESRAKGHIVSHGLGDWADFVMGKPIGASQLTPIPLTATAIYYHDVTILAQVATLLEKPDDARRYAALAKEIRAAFNQTLFDPRTNQYASGSQTAQAMPLVLGLVDPDRTAGVFARLVDEVRQRDHITAGDIGFRFLLRALAEHGRNDLIYQLNNRTTLPGYGYQMEQGATSLTEAWDGQRVVSQNHCMLGHILEWFHADLLGIRRDRRAVAFRRIVIRPRIVGDLRWARGRYDSIRGPIAVDWQLDGHRLSLKVAIPANTSATVYVPTSNPTEVLESGKPAADATGVAPVGEEDRAAVYRVESGRYTFTAPWQ